jgi:ABC-type antimicrobial peptide transport system permease subunit
MYSMQLFGGVGEEFELDYGPAGILRFRVVGLLAGSIFQGSLLIREADLTKHFSNVGGYRYFLVDTPTGQSKKVAKWLEDALSEQDLEVGREAIVEIYANVLEDALSDQGLDLTDTDQLLTELLAVQNTYLSTFQSLGGLGLLLGTFGLAAVQLRNVVQRRGELALLRATGFRNDQLTMLVLREHALLLLGGFAVGVASAAVVVSPHLLFGGASIPFGLLMITLGLVAIMGLASGLVAQRYLSRLPLLPALGEN